LSLHNSKITVYFGKKTYIQVVLKQSLSIKISPENSHKIGSFLNTNQFSAELKFSHKISCFFHYVSENPVKFDFSVAYQ